MTNTAFLSRLRWMCAGLVLAITMVTLWAQEPQMSNRGINITQGNLITSRGYVYSGGSPVRDFRTATADNTAAAATYTAAEVLSGLILRSPAGGANVTDVMPTAANLIAAMPGAVTGMSFTTFVDAGATPNAAITLNGASTGVTYGSGCGTAFGTSDVQLLLITVTSTTTYRVTCMNVNT